MVTAIPETVTDTSQWVCISSKAPSPGGPYTSMVFGEVLSEASIVRVGDSPYLTLQLKCPLFSRFVKNRKSTKNTEERSSMSVRVDAPIAYAYHEDTDTNGIIGGKFAWLATITPGTKLLCYGTLHFDPFRVIVSAIRKAKDTDGFTLIKLQPSVVDSEADGVARLHYVADESDVFRLRLPRDTILSSGAVIAGVLKCDYTGQFRSPYSIRNLGFVAPEQTATASPVREGGEVN